MEKIHRKRGNPEEICASFLSLVVLPVAVHTVTKFYNFPLQLYQICGRICHKFFTQCDYVWPNYIVYSESVTHCFHSSNFSSEHGSLPYALQLNSNIFSFIFTRFIQEYVTNSLWNARIFQIHTKLRLATCIQIDQLTWLFLLVCSDGGVPWCRLMAVFPTHSD